MRAYDIQPGRKLMLKPERAEAYGLCARRVLTVSETFTHPGRANVYVRVADFPAPENVFLASDFAMVAK